MPQAVCADCAAVRGEGTAGPGPVGQAFTCSRRAKRLAEEPRRRDEPKIRSGRRKVSLLDDEADGGRLQRVFFFFQAKGTGLLFPSKSPKAGSET